MDGLLPDVISDSLANIRRYDGMTGGLHQLRSSSFGAYDWQITIFVFLYIVTIFRKKLSSNSVYVESSSGHSCPKSNDIIDLKSQRRRRDSSVEIENHIWHSLNACLVEEITSYMNPCDIALFSQANRTSNKFSLRDQVWKKQWENRFGSLLQSPVWKECLRRWSCDWNPRVRPSQGWKQFFFEFEGSWLDIVAAGHDSEKLCLIGIEGALYDITDFIDSHPGSPETLLDNAGKDTTEFFKEIGHSKSARIMMRDFIIFRPKGKFSNYLPICATGNSKSNSLSDLKVPQHVLNCLRTGVTSSKLVENFQHLPSATARCSFHEGNIRVLYVPMVQKWACWWTCCRSAEWIDTTKFNLPIQVNESPFMSAVRRKMPNLIRFV